MKKILFLTILIIFISTVTQYNYENVFDSNTYNILFKKDEIGITFILENDVNILLINDENNVNDLIILDYKSIEILKKELEKFNIPQIRNIYNINPVILNIYNKNSIELKPDKNNIINLKYIDKNFCIYMNNTNIMSEINCEFIYMYKFDKTAKINFGDNIKLVFQNYNNELPIRLQENLYQNWIDLYTINSYEYTTLKILKDGFDTIIIPIIK